MHSNEVMSSSGSYVACLGITDGKFEQPFDVGIKIRGMLEDSTSNLVYKNIIHNRSRLLTCAQVSVASFLKHLSAIG